jgi:hypothetical protein
MTREFIYADDLRLDQALSHFRAAGLPFRVEKTGSSVCLVNASVAWTISHDRFLPWHLAMLSRVKAEVKRNLASIEGMQETDGESFKVNLCSFPGARGSVEYDELDLVTAYLTAARELGLLSPGTVKKLNRYPKKWRLRILGAIASRKTVQEYDATGAPAGSSVKMDAELRRAWFVIVGYVDRFQNLLMEALGPDFLFYWYDNTFCTRGALTARLRDAVGLPHKVNHGRLSWIRKGSLMLVTIDGKRRFFLPVPDLTHGGGRS